MNAPTGPTTKTEIIVQYVDIFKSLSTDPKPLDFVLPGFLAGTVGILFAKGSTGKSFWSLEAAIAIGCEVAGANVLELDLKTSGSVLYLSLEDPVPVIEHRLRAVGRRISLDAMRAVDKNFQIADLNGKCFDLMDDSWITWAITAGQGKRIIIVDTVSRIHHMDENSNGDMGALMQRLDRLAAETGAAILLLHHANKAADRMGDADQQGATRGASVLLDNARFGAAMIKMTAHEGTTYHTTDGKKIAGRKGFYVRMSFPKINYSMAPDDCWYERTDGGVLVPAELLSDEVANDEDNDSQGTKKTKKVKRGLANLMGDGADEFDEKRSKQDEDLAWLR